MQEPAQSEDSLIFGKYRIIQRLAIGGMGEIFLARQSDTLIDRFVILKSLLPDLAANQTFVQQFLGEARVAATLNHPHIVSIYEVGAWDGIYFIAMEYIDGPDLSKLLGAALRARRLVPPHLAARIVLDAATALEHSTEARDADGNPLNIVHRDISPQNIMLRRDGVTKVVDFGIARAANLASRTLTGQVKGKLAYMPPEQLLGESVDWRADQYALGVVLWELVTSERLIRPGMAHLELIETTTKFPMKSPREVEPDVSEELEAMILRMGERDPDERFQSWAEVRSALKAFLDGWDEPASPDELAAFLTDVGGGELGKLIWGEEGESPENFLINLKAGSTVALPGADQDLVSTLKESDFNAETRVDVPSREAYLAQHGAVLGGRAEVALGGERPAPWRRGVLLLGSLLVGVGLVALASVLRSDVPAQYEAPASLVENQDSETAQPVETPEVPQKAAAPTPREEKSLRDPPPPPPLPVAVPPETSTVQNSRAERERPQGMGVVTLDTIPWTRVFIDGQPHGPTPIRKSFAAGKHRVRLVRIEEGIDFKDWIKVGAGEKLKRKWQWREGTDGQGAVMESVLNEVTDTSGKKIYPGGKK